MCLVLLLVMCVRVCSHTLSHLFYPPNPPHLAYASTLSYQSSLFCRHPLKHEAQSTKHTHCTFHFNCPCSVTLVCTSFNFVSSSLVSPCLPLLPSSLVLFPSLPSLPSLLCNRCEGASKRDKLTNASICFIFLYVVALVCFVAWSDHTYTQREITFTLSSLLHTHTQPTYSFFFKQSVCAVTPFPFFFPER